jgi:hypothetical protein
MAGDVCEDLYEYKWFGFFWLADDPEDAGDDYQSIPPLTA